MSCWTPRSMSGPTCSNKRSRISSFRRSPCLSSLVEATTWPRIIRPTGFPSARLDTSPNRRSQVLLVIAVGDCPLGRGRETAGDNSEPLRVEIVAQLFGNLHDDEGVAAVPLHRVHS